MINFGTARSTSGARRVVVLAVSALVLGGMTVPLARAEAPSATGAYVSVAPFRAVNSFTGAYGNLHGPLRARSSTLVTVGGVGGVPTTGVAAVAITITAEQGTAPGALVAYCCGGVPETANLQFAAGQRVSNFAVARVENSQFQVYNRAYGAVQLLVDVSGYYLAGDDPPRPGAMDVDDLGAPARAVDTRSTPEGSLPAHVARTFSLSRFLGASESVAVTFNVFSPSRAGTLTAYAGGTSRPSVPTYRFLAGVSGSGFAIVPVSSDRQITVFNGTIAPIDFSIDLSAAYVVKGVPADSGALRSLDPQRVLDTRADGGGGAIAPATTRTVRLAGVAGIALGTGQSALVTLTAVSTAAPGGLIAWPGGPRPSVSSVQFGTAQNLSDVALVPVAPDGTISLYNASARPLSVLVDVFGFVLDKSIFPSEIAPERMVRNLVPGQTDFSEMRGEGNEDVEYGVQLVVLDFGAQLDDGTGVALTGVGTRIPYAEVVAAAQSYLDGFGSLSFGSPTVAIGTNNDGADWTDYTGAERGADWANKVIDQLVPPAGTTLVAANDIEPQLGTMNQSDASDWVDAYLAATTAGLIYNGAAQGCSTTFGFTGRTCRHGWTQMGIYNVAHRGDRIQVLPRIDQSAQATQWANIDATGGGELDFLGSLFTSAKREGVGIRGQQNRYAWTSLYLALSTVRATPDLPEAVESCVTECHGD